MSTSPMKGDPRIRDVRCTRTDLVVEIDDGRGLRVPLSWYPRLERATPGQRRSWRLISGGVGVHWPDLDEDLSLEGLLRGVRSPEVGRGRLFRRSAAAEPGRDTRRKGTAKHKD